MPAKNPRLTITLKPTTAALMRRISELTGNSQSALICELLEANEGVFSKLVAVLEAAHAAQTALSEETKAGLVNAQAKMEAQLGLVLETMDEATAPLLREAEAITRRAVRKAPEGAPLRGGRPVPGGGRRGAVTPPSNRGVRSTPDKPKKPTRTRT
jgi:hypothetical protein